MDLSRFRAILRTLSSHGVDYIVVGGVAAVLDGVPAQTFDLDLAHSRTPENLTRLVAALTEIDAHYRLHPKRITPNESHLASTGHHLLMTRYGMLDMLGTVGKDRTYDDLVPHSAFMEIEPTVNVRVLDLETLIATKEEANRPKDQQILPVLRATLAEIRRLQSGSSTTSE